MRLSSSGDLVCNNLMCAKIGEPCVCRLLRVLQRAPQVRELALDGNNLDTLPDLREVLPRLETLDISRNRFRELPAFLGAMPSLRTLVADDNAIAALPEGLGAAGGLELVSLRGNPISRRAAEAALGGGGGRGTRCVLDDREQ